MIRWMLVLLQSVSLFVIMAENPTRPPCWTAGESQKPCFHVLIMYSPFAFRGTHECESECINGWAPALSYTCSCPNGKYLLKDGQSCDTCFGEWELSNYYFGNIEQFPSLSKYPLSKFDDNGFLSCSSCNSGLRYRNRTVAFSDDCVRYLFLSPRFS